MKKEKYQVRIEFWKNFTSNLHVDLERYLKSLNIPHFSKQAKFIVNQSFNDLFRHLDDILTPTIVSYIIQNKEKTKGIYDSLFNINYHETISKLSEFDSNSVANLYRKTKKFRYHFKLLFQRLARDWPEIYKTFEIKEGDYITTCKLTSGDGHFDGTQTSLFRFNDSSKGFVYKPINMNLDLLICELQKFLGTQVYSKVISKSDQIFAYGYVQLVEEKLNFESYFDAKRIYSSMGQLLAWGKFFKISDGHCDNIIITKQNARWIDLETCFHFSKDFIYDIHPLEETGLISDVKEDNAYIGIVTGIQGGNIPMLSLTSPVIVDDGTDDMRIQYFDTFTPSLTYNRFSINNKLAYPEDYISSIQDGYKKELSFLVKNADRIIDFISNYMKSNTMHCRYLVQMTAYYARFISLLNHTIALKNNDTLAKIRYEREKTLIGSEIDNKDFFIENELSDFIQGVIPYYYRTNTDTNLYHASGDYIENFFETSLKDQIISHIKSIKADEVSITNDCAFIKKALLSTANVHSFEDFAKKFNFKRYNETKPMDSV